MLAGKREKRRGFHYTVSLEDIRAYKKLPLKDKLTWLEEANQFSHKMIRGRTRRIWEAFRQGRI